MKHISHRIKKLSLASIFIPLFIFAVMLTPVFITYAQNGSPPTSDSDAVGKGLVPCGNSTTPVVIDATTGQSTGGQLTKPCTFKSLMDLINNVVHFILFFMVVPIAAIMFAYCGFLLVTANGETSKRNKAKSIAGNVVWGLIIAIAAWLIIETVLKLLGYDGSAYGF